MNLNNYENIENFVPNEIFLKLNDIRTFLENYYLNIIGDNFPKNKCQKTSGLVNKIMGFEIVSGVFIPKKRRSLNWQYEMHIDKAHTWNYDPINGIYIDLTQDQFKETDEKIVILPKNNLILKEMNFNEYKKSIFHEQDLLKLNNWIEEKYKSFINSYKK